MIAGVRFGFGTAIAPFDPVAETLASIEFQELAAGDCFEISPN